MINCQHVMSVQKGELFFLRQSENKLIYYGKSRYKKRDLLSLATTILINFRVPVWAFLIIYTKRFLFGNINTTFFWQRTTLLNLLSISITKKNFLTELLDMCRISISYRSSLTIFVIYLFGGLWWDSASASSRLFSIVPFSTNGNEYGDLGCKMPLMFSRLRHRSVSIALPLERKIFSSMYDLQTSSGKHRLVMHSGKDASIIFLTSFLNFGSLKQI